MSISKAIYTQYLPVSQSKRPPICITLHFSKLNACQYNRIVTSQILRYQYNIYDREYIDVRIYIHSNLLEQFNVDHPFQVGQIIISTLEGCWKSSIQKYTRQLLYIDDFDKMISYMHLNLQLGVILMCMCSLSGIIDMEANYSTSVKYLPTYIRPFFS